MRKYEVRGAKYVNSQQSLLVQTKIFVDDAQTNNQIDLKNIINTTKYYLCSNVILSIKRFSLKSTS